MKPSDIKTPHDFEMYIRQHVSGHLAEFYHNQITILSEMIMGCYAESDRYTQKAIKEQVSKYGFLQ